MQPRSHRFILERALGIAEAPWVTRQRTALLGGSDDEDVYAVPFTRIRLPAIGLTHTYRPGRERGELGAPSARTRLLVFVERSERELRRDDETRAAWWLGRACHLLVDMAVPARTRGVWHVFGDPLESWVERAVLAEDGRLVPAEGAAVAGDAGDAGDAGALADGLAALSSPLPADTTRGPFGRLRQTVLGGGVRVDDAEAEAQALVLVPAAIASTAALLRLVSRAR
jgi:hypothetical protein